jgi:hypothetical protein
MLMYQPNMKSTYVKEGIIDGLLYLFDEHVHRCFKIRHGGLI